MNTETQNFNSTSGASSRTLQLTLIALMAAVTCILAPISIPLPGNLVPISLGTLAIYLTVYVLGMKRGTISCIIYLLLGLAGLPVFSAYTGGAAKLLGPTGGYLIGYIFITLIAGFFIEKWPGNLLLHLVGLVLGTAACYILGTAWIMLQGIYSSLAVAIGACVLPFIPVDLLKIVVTLLIGSQIRTRLRKAGLV